jgi:hypothetical protein
MPASVPGRRVVITGIGAVTPIGLGAEGLWAGLLRRRSAVRTITRFDPTVFKSRIAGEVNDFHPTDHLEERRARRLDRYSQFTLAATRMAIENAGLDLRRENPDCIGAMMGTALGGVAHGEQQYHNFLTQGPRSVDPALALRPQPHARAPSGRRERRARCVKLGLATHYTLLEDASVLHSSTSSSKPGRGLGLGACRPRRSYEVAEKTSNLWLLASSFWLGSLRSSAGSYSGQTHTSMGSAMAVTMMASGRPIRQ